ncbi:MAG TPA: hypothetical protein DHW78_04245 [Ruminococcaceae bacterium]|nr:hypothetical protein [Oscillospiraceae bacterium]
MQGPVIDFVVQFPPAYLLKASKLICRKYKKQLNKNKKVFIRKNLINTLVYSVIIINGPYAFVIIEYAQICVNYEQRLQYKHLSHTQSVSNKNKSKHKGHFGIG